MALYYYHAFSKDGKRLSGQFDAPSEQAVKDSLIKKGLFPIEIGLSHGTSVGVPWYKQLFEGRVSLKEKIMFTKQLSVLLRSGIPLLPSLELLTDQFQGQLRMIIVQLKDGVKEGRSLTDGLKMYPKTFDKIYVQLVRAGEATGNLEIILQRLNTYLERQAALTKKVKSAMRYPLMQLAVVSLVAVFLLIVIVPKITQTFSSQGGTLPLPTRILIAISDFLRHQFILFGIIIVALVVGYRYWSSKPQGAYMIDKLKLRLPLIGYFVRTSAIVQFSRTLGMLLEGGVRLSEALSIVCDIIDNRVLADALEKAKDNIVKEGKITQYLKQTGLFPPMAIYLIGTGEESGELDSMLQSVAENYEEELSEISDGLAAKLEPVMLLVMAVVVGFIVVAMILPIVGMNKLISKR